MGLCNTMKSLTNPIFNDLAIAIPAGEAAQFFFGDNIEGYHEGYTHSTGRGSGYWIGGQPVFRDVIPGKGDTLRPHDQAVAADILPHAIRHQHRGLIDEVSILHRQRAVAIALHAVPPGPLVAAPLFDPGVGDLAITAHGDAWVVSCAKSAWHIGIAATSPLRFTGWHTHNDLKGPRMRTRRAARHVVLYLAFETTPAKAARRALRLRDEQGLDAHRNAIDDILNRSRVLTSDHRYNRAVAWAKLTSYFLVTEEFGKGIWAGLPWFKNNWGRDTFIALPGTLLVSGMFDDARDVILNFLRYQDRNPASPTYGRVPNRVQSATDIIYNTADGTPWLIRELYEYLQYTGDMELARQVYPDIKLALEGAIEKFVDAEGFLTHDDADTWMDARIMGNLPWSARGNRANDIQALWHNALLIGARLATYAGDEPSGARWQGMADVLRTRFTKRFWNARTKTLADRITADNRRDEKIRPNQLMVISIPMIEPLLNEGQEEAVVRQAVTSLLYPYGIASLSQDDPYFHPFHHNDTWHHYDAAYHNGTVWGWNAGFTVTALCRHRQTRLAWKLAGNLADQILDLGCRGSMSELIEAIPKKPGQLHLSGTWAQAWSTSEFVRNAHQDFGGFQPRLLDGELHLHPHLPDDWTDFSATFPFGQGARLLVSFTRWNHQPVLHIRMEGHPSRLDLHLTFEHGGKRFALVEPLLPGNPILLTITQNRAWLQQRVEVPGQRLPTIKPLAFRKPVLKQVPPCLRKPHYLQKLIESGKFR